MVLLVYSLFNSSLLQVLKGRGPVDGVGDHTNDHENSSDSSCWNNYTVAAIIRATTPAGGWHNSFHRLYVFVSTGRYTVNADRYGAQYYQTYKAKEEKEGGDKL